MSRGSAGDSDAWVVDLPALGGITGPFNALDRIRRHVEATGSEAAGTSGASFDVTVGDHLRCSGSRPIADPPGLALARTVSLQPATGSTASCLDWFSVDLFLADSGEIGAVLLDVWEP